MVQLWLCLFGLLVSSLAASAHQEQRQQSYLEAYGKYTAVADRLAQLLEAEEPLQPEHVQRLAVAFT